MGHPDPTIETLDEGQGGKIEEDYVMVTPLISERIRTRPRWSA